MQTKTNSMQLMYRAKKDGKQSTSTVESTMAHKLTLNLVRSGTYGLEASLGSLIGLGVDANNELITETVLLEGYLCLRSNSRRTREETSFVPEAINLSASRRDSARLPRCSPLPMRTIPSTPCRKPASGCTISRRALPHKFRRGEATCLPCYSTSERASPRQDVSTNPNLFVEESMVRAGISHHYLASARIV